MALPANAQNEKTLTYILLFSAFFIAASGLGFEIVTGTLASYLLGDSATQFSLTIGIYLFAMGIGSYLSKYIENKVLERFIEIEVLVGVVGGLSAMLLFLAFAQTDFFSVLLWALLLIIGTLVGIEIPLLLRILKDKLDFKDLVSRVLSLDYIGGLGAAILIPVFLTPHLGLVRTALLFGLLNLVVALACIYLFRRSLPARRYAVITTTAILVLLSVFFASQKLVRFSEAQLYADNIIYSKTSLYQRLVLTRWGEQFSLFLNNNLQFNSVDEYRYHEAIVHPALLRQAEKKEKIQALVLGGGDGLAIRELLKVGQVSRVDLVELDPEMVSLARGNALLSRLNRNSLQSDRVRVIVDDAFTWLASAHQQGLKYDVVIVDFPDPNNFSLGKLYSKTFYRRLKTVMHEDALAVTQATSPLFARKAYWCINQTIKQSGFLTYPYHAYVPSFGEWGFILFSKSTYQPPAESSFSRVDLKFLNPATLPPMFIFPSDMSEIKTDIQQLNSQHLVSYYTQGWNAIIK